MEQHKQNRILSAAHDLFGQHGFKRVAIDEIARKAGVSKGTVYNFAESKDDLYFKVVEEELTAWVSECAARIDPTRPADEMLIGNGIHSFEYLDTKPLLRQLLVEDLDYSMKMWIDRLDHIRRMCAQNGTRILKMGIEQKLFRPDLDVDTTALVMNDILVQALVMKYRRSPSEALIWASAAMDLILRGLKLP